jgi:hypothetical protein
MLNMRARERSGRLFIYVSLLFLFLKKISKRKRKSTIGFFLTGNRTLSTSCGFTGGVVVVVIDYNDEPRFICLSGL